MPKSDAKRRADLLQGTLDMLILKTLTAGQMHGYAIARKIQQSSQDALVVEEGSLYPALHRMARRGLIQHEWGVSETNRRAKYYKLTPAGRKQLTAETKRWTRFSEAVGLILNPPAMET